MTDRNSDAYRDKVQEYQEKQRVLVAELVEFYDGLRAGLDGGQITVDAGKISKDGEWSYELDRLSPFDKFALYEYLSGRTDPNPFYLPAWELLNHYSPEGGSWWGHCNGWAAAAILTHEPREDLPVQVAGHDLLFTHADLKGLLTEAHYGQQSYFYGERYNGSEQDIDDLYPEAFHRIITFYIRDRGVPLVFDTSRDVSVWNYPAYHYKLTLEETTDPSVYDRVNLNTVSREELMELATLGEAEATAIIHYRLNVRPLQTVEELLEIDGIGADVLEPIADQVTVDPVERRFSAAIDLGFTTDQVSETHVDGDEPSGFYDHYNYTLTTDEDGLLTGGQWDYMDHPDFAWVPFNNPQAPNTDGSENAYLHYGHLVEMMGEDIIRR